MMTVATGNVFVVVVVVVVVIPEQLTRVNGEPTGRGRGLCMSDRKGQTPSRPTEIRKSIDLNQIAKIDLQKPMTKDRSRKKL